jgi:hypothetical protein
MYILESYLGGDVKDIDLAILGDWDIDVKATQLMYISIQSFFHDNAINDHRFSASLLAKEIVEKCSASENKAK